ncbi:MAG: T9SS type A sorting domain-containing protein [Saprospiraceae bacterium]|nr:T9SS type A sorting domain-containing protein [Saprospiraceae bacterium]
MKYTFTLLLSFLMILGVQAQKEYTKTQDTRTVDDLRPLTYRSGQGLAMDTLFPTIFDDECSDTLWTFQPSTQWGNVFGTNGFLDAEKAQKFKFDDAATYSVFDVGVFFSQASVVGDGNLRVKIYSVNARDGGPDQLLGMSQDIKVSDIQLDEQDLAITFFDLENPIEINQDAFYVSVDFSSLYETNDTVGVFHTDVDCGSGEDAWELFNGLWGNMFDSWGGLQSEMAVVAFVDFQESTSTEDINEYVSIKTYPSPARDVVNIEYTLKESSQVNIELYGLDGRRIAVLPQGQQSTGKHNLQVDVSDWVNGSYLTRITTERGVITRKIVVVH